MFKHVSQITVLCFVVLSFSCTLTKDYVPERKPMYMADIPPFELGTTEIGVDVGFVGVKVANQEIEVLYHPRTNDVSLEFSFFFNKVTLMLDMEARAGFSNSLYRYIEEFNDKKLVTRGKTKEMYDEVRGLVKWGTITQNGESMPEIHYGYVFSGKLVYFTITVFPGENYHEASKEYLDENPSMTICLSIAQAEKLAKMMNEVNLREALKGKEENKTNDADTYIESE